MKDISIITIYDLENGGAPLVCHRVDAREFLHFPRWSLTPAEGVAAPVEIETDSGQAMQLNEMTLKSLQGMANKAGIDARTIRKMNKAELVDALK
jgi:hypothetical protein